MRFFLIFLLFCPSSICAGVYTYTNHGDETLHDPDGRPTPEVIDLEPLTGIKGHKLTRVEPTPSPEESWTENGLKMGWPDKEGNWRVEYICDHDWQDSSYTLGGGEIDPRCHRATLEYIPNLDCDDSVPVQVCSQCGLIRVAPEKKGKDLKSKGRD